MDTLAAQQQGDVGLAQKLKPPRGLSDPNASMIEALQFRVSGLRGLSQALRAGAGSTKVAETATALALQGQRLVASDVIWEDKFRQPTLSQMTQQNITGHRGAGVAVRRGRASTARRSGARSSSG